MARDPYMRSWSIYRLFFPVCHNGNRQLKYKQISWGNLLKTSSWKPCDREEKTLCTRISACQFCTIQALFLREVERIIQFPRHSSVYTWLTGRCSARWGTPCPRVPPSPRRSSCSRPRTTRTSPSPTTSSSSQPTAPTRKSWARRRYSHIRLMIHRVMPMV